MATVYPTPHCWTNQQWHPADAETLTESRMQGKLARPVWGWGPGETPGPTPLFAGNDQAAENHARLWSLIASCERHHVDPQRYLISVLAKIGSTTAEELDQFLPDVWGREDKAEPATNEK